MKLDNGKKVTKLLNDYTRQIYDGTVAAWSELEAQYWLMFGMGF